MAKSTPNTAQIPVGAMRICYERIVPDDVHPFGTLDRESRITYRNALAATYDHPLSADEVGQVRRMAVINAKKWPNGAVLRCRFLDGSAKQRKRVEEKAHLWEKHANLKLKFVATGSAEIRISFNADPGSWSAVGRDALIEQYFPKHQPTMNYGWLRDDTDDAEYSRVVLHEFGHAFGCIHEHQTPKFTRKWNTAVVYATFSGPPNYWTKEQIDHNVLRKYSPQGISATVFDPKSMMLYHFDGKLFADGGGPTNQNSTLSSYDIRLIGQLYPKQGARLGAAGGQDTEAEPAETSAAKSKRKVPKKAGGRGKTARSKATTKK